MLFPHPSFSVTPTHESPKPDDLFVCFDSGKLLLAGEDDALCLPTMTQATPLLDASFAPFELAHIDGTSLFSPHPFLGSAPAEGAGLRYHPVGVFRSLDYDAAGIIASCWHLWSWYERNQFCGKCGARLAPDSIERALHCPRCGQLLFPMIAPAVIVAITQGNQILLARNLRSAVAHHTLISGYVEVGETLEHAVHRETLEEVGLHLRSLRYLGDQPWGISGSHMFAFQAEAMGDEPLVVQKSELSEARWFHRDELKPQNHMIGVAFELIERFRTGRL